MMHGHLPRRPPGSWVRGSPEQLQEGGQEQESAQASQGWPWHTQPSSSPMPACPFHILSDGHQSVSQSVASETRQALRSPLWLNAHFLGPGAL